MIALAIIVLAAGGAHGRPPACSVSPATNGEIAPVLNAFFDALRTEDTAAFQRLTTKTFYAFDAGERYPGTALVDVVRRAHASSVQLNWSVGALATKSRCNVAWSTWENVGSAGIPPAVKPARWLESAVLIRDHGKWKIDFFHSQRATAK